MKEIDTFTVLMMIIGTISLLSYLGILLTILFREYYPKKHKEIKKTDIADIDAWSELESVFEMKRSEEII